jgi:uncharacterized protein (DUF1499 family)
LEHLLNLSPLSTILTLALLGVVVWASGMVGAAWWSTQRAPALGLAAPGALSACPDTPNCVSSQAPESDQRHWIAPLPAGSGSVAEQRSRVLAGLEAAFGDRVSPVESPGFDEQGYGRWAVRTPTLGFVDDLELLHDAEAGVFHVRSASRVGGGDGGANRKRVESLTAALETMPAE